MAQPHPNTRLEALCDGVFAIALTLLILEVKLPDVEGIASTADLWSALRHLAPSAFAFVLSFGVILITWVGHHALLKLVSHSSASFMYANGLLLLTIVTLPFTAALLGEFLWTDHAAPAVVLYNALLAAQAIGWIVVTGAALRGRLTTDDSATAAIRKVRSNAYAGFALYALLAVTALWLPVAVAVMTTTSWIFWLGLGIRMKRA